MEGDLEIIVVDNGSTDGTLRLASRRARTLTSPPGRGVAMNAGAAAATGDTLLFLHADTRLPDSAFEAIATAMADEGTVAGHFAVTFDGDDWRSSLVTRLYAAFSRAGFFYGDSAIFVRRSVFRSLGGFHQLPLMEDFDLCLRLRKTGRIARLPTRVRTSDRRWKRQGFLRTILVFLMIQGLYIAGYRRPALFNLYRAVR